MLRATAALMLLLLAAATNGSHAGLRASQGLGRDTKCLDPPPPLRDPSLTAAAAKAGAAPSHLKYLGMDGAVGDDRALGYPGTPWVSLGFMAPGTAWNLTRLRHQKANGVAMMANMHGFTTGSGCMYNYTCWHKGFIGPNATAGGLWNNTIEPAVKAGLMMGIYIGDELLGGGMLVKDLTAVFELCKAVWPEGITYYNEEWFPLNDPTWHDKSGQPYGKVPTALDWISYDFYRLNNVSWLQPMCEYPQNLYTKMNDKQRAVLLPGGWGSTSGPRGGQSWTVKSYSSWINCTDQMACTSDPFSCSNINLTKDTAGYVDPKEGLVYQVETLLTQIGGRPCWELQDYDNFNALQAQKYYEWAASDPRIIGIVIFPWGGDSPDWTPLSGGAYAGLNVALGPHLQPNATRAWAAIGTKIRAGQAQALPNLGGETRSPLDELPAEAEQQEEMPASLEEAHRMIRSLRARLGSEA